MQEKSLKTKFEFGNPELWYVFGIAMVVCITGKFFGVTLPTYWSGQSLPFSITLVFPRFEGEALDQKRLITYARDQARLRGTDIEQRPHGKRTLWTARRAATPAP